MSPVAEDLRVLLAEDGVLAIVRYRADGDVLGAAETLMDAGIRALEITADTPGVWNAVAVASYREGVKVGVGTVCDAEQVRRAADAGATFVVSPGLAPDVLEAAQSLGLATFPGVATGTEVMAACRLGADFAKLYPAGALGLRYFSELRTPFPDVAFVATGGVGLEGIAAWRSAGALAVALGSALVGSAAPVDATGHQELRQRALTAIASARTAAAA